MRNVGAIEHRVQDLRFAIRQLARYRGFASAAVVVPALGIAASIAILFVRRLALSTGPDLILASALERSNFE